jgi:hypothetical protein
MGEKAQACAESEVRPDEQPASFIDVHLLGDQD